MKILSLTTACILAGCITTSSLALETNQETIYMNKCTECHGLKGEGIPAKKGPSLNHQSIADLNITILDLQGELSINGSSTGDHIDMEHNIREFEKEGFFIKPLEMSKFIYNSFNPEAKN